MRALCRRGEQQARLWWAGCRHEVKGAQLSPMQRWVRAVAGAIVLALCITFVAVAVDLSAQAKSAASSSNATILAEDLILSDYCRACANCNCLPLDALWDCSFMEITLADALLYQ